MIHDDVVAACLADVKRLAYRHAWKARHLSLDDLVGVGLLAIVETAHKHQQVNKTYLLQAAEWKMRDTLCWRDDLLGRPDEVARLAPTQSLDTLLTDDPDGETLGDVLLQKPMQATERDFTPLYEALTRLTDKQRTTVMRRYGLMGYGASLGVEIAAQDGVSQEAVRDRLQYALRRLQKDASLRQLIDR